VFASEAPASMQLSIPKEKNAANEEKGVKQTLLVKEGDDLRTRVHSIMLNFRSDFPI
jgi:hypothetical protein